MSEGENDQDDLFLQDPWLLAELGKENDSMSSTWLASNGFSETVITLRFNGEDWFKVVSKSQLTAENITNPIDLSGLAHAVANAVTKAFYERLTKKLPSNNERELDSCSFDVEKFMYGLPQFVPIKTYAMHEILVGRENYWEWMRMIILDLEESNMHLWIQSKFAESTGLPLDVRMRYENQVQQILYASIVRRLHPVLAQFDSSWEIFEHLEKRFGQQKTRDIIDLFNRLECVQVRPRQQMRQFLDLFANLREEFRLRLPHLDDLFFCAKLLLKLKSWYPEVVQTLMNASKEQLTFDLIRERILVAEKAERTQLNTRMHQFRNQTSFPYMISPDSSLNSRSRPVKRNLSNFVPTYEAKKLRTAREDFNQKNCRRRCVSMGPSVHKQWRPPLSVFQQQDHRYVFGSRRPVDSNWRHACPLRHNDDRSVDCFGCGRKGHRIAACPNINGDFCAHCNKSGHIGQFVPNIGRGRKAHHLYQCDCERFR